MAKGIRRLTITGAFLMAAILGAIGLRPVIGGATHTRVVVQQAAACSDASFSGTYGFLISGWRLVGPDGSQLSTPVPIAVVGVGTYDGAGNLTSGTLTANVGGRIIPLSATGSYTVNADCTGTQAINFDNGRTEHHAFVLVDGGKEVRDMVSDPEQVASGTLKPIPGACSDATLSGSYGASVSGWALLGPDGSPRANPVPLSSATVTSYDGAGNQTGASTNNTNGTTSQVTWTGTYSVNADCTYTLTENLTNGTVRHLAGVIVEGGSEIFAIGTDPASVTAITGTAQ